jgi:hypothetical protein
MIDEKRLEKILNKIVDVIGKNKFSETFKKDIENLTAPPDCSTCGKIMKINEEAWNKEYICCNNIIKSDSPKLF